MRCLWQMVKSKSLDDIEFAFESICYLDGGLVTNFATLEIDISLPYFFTNPNIFSLCNKIKRATNGGLLRTQVLLRLFS